MQKGWQNSQWPGAETASREEALKLSLVLAKFMAVPPGMVGKLLRAIPGGQPSRGREAFHWEVLGMVTLGCWGRCHRWEVLGMMPLGCRGRCHPLRGAGHDEFEMPGQVPFAERCWALCLWDAGSGAICWEMLDMMPLRCQGRCHHWEVLGQVPSLRGAGHDDFTMPGKVLLKLGAGDAPLCVWLLLLPWTTATGDFLDSSPRGPRPLHERGSGWGAGGSRAGSGPSSPSWESRRTSALSGWLVPPPSSLTMREWLLFPPFPVSEVVYEELVCQEGHWERGKWSTHRRVWAFKAVGLAQRGPRPARQQILDTEQRGDTLEGTGWERAFQKAEEASRKRPWTSFWRRGWEGLGARECFRQWHRSDDVSEVDTTLYLLKSARQIVQNSEAGSPAWWQWGGVHVWPAQIPRSKDRAPRHLQPSTCLSSGERSVGTGT